MTAREAMRPIQVGLAVFTRESGTDTQLLMATATITVLPVVALYFLVQQRLIEGIASTGIRGWLLWRSAPIVGGWMVDGGDVRGAYGGAGSGQGWDRVTRRDGHIRRERDGTVSGPPHPGWA